jgi:hypothetical protein
MPAISGNDLMSVAPNIIVDVGTPAPPTLPEDKPQYVFNPLFIYSRKTQPIEKDTTKDLIGKTKPAPPSSFLVKTYGPNSTVKAPPSPPPPPSSSLLASSLPPSPPSTKDSYPDLPDDLPFDEIKYTPKDLSGVSPEGAKDPFIKSMYASFTHFPSAVYIDEIKSCISTPYFSPEAKRHRNGVLGDSRTVDRQHTTYMWEMEDKNERREVLTPRPDGIIDVEPQSRDAKSPRGFVYLDPGKWETRVKIKNGKSLNAFSLILGIAPGGGDSKSQAARWAIGITFGDVTFILREGKTEAEITIKGSEPPTTMRMIKPSSVSHVTEGFGQRPYVLTFIPVWNGILISDGIPGSSDWADSVKFIRASKSLDINQAINETIYVPPKTPEETYQSNLPPKAVVNRNKKNYKQPGVRVTDLDKQKNTPFKMGSRLNIMYYHCGGALKFVPLYFPQFSRYHLLCQGAADFEDLKQPKSWQDWRGTHFGPPPLDPNVFLVKTHSKAVTMPVFSYGSTQPVDFRTHFTTIVFDKNAPYGCFSMEFKACNPDVRCPIQVWAGLIMDQISAKPDMGDISNKTGVLSVDAISEPRIRSVSISRSLDGSNGEIVWDRFNPITQQLDARPFQEVGAIQINAWGGANTVPGTIFTGIAYGNAEEDQPGENVIRIPLKGLESKFSSEGGLGLLSAPAFDAYDHRDAMTFMAIYGGFALDTKNTKPFRLLAADNIQAPAVWFPQGTPLLDAMNKICELASTLFYFDRFGTCVYMGSDRSTGVNWDYSDLTLESFSDEPDHTWVRNHFVIFGMVNLPNAGDPIKIDPRDVEKMMHKCVITLNTYPKFDWSKMAVYTIDVIVKDVSEIIRMATQISLGQSRPRSTSRCKVPGNADLELGDTINKKWIIASLSHQIDLQRKTWSTDVSVELLVPDQEPTIASRKLGPPGDIPK